MGLALRAIGQNHSASERELVAAVRQGDDRAFEELFARYRSRITAYVLGMVRDHARAEDITQEVFLSALRRLRDTERPIAFKPWIYEIARNACIDEFRRTRRATEVSLTTDEESGGGERDLVSMQFSLDAAIENKLRLEALRGAFRGLSENHHRILVMRELEGLSYQEIAQRMGMSRPMVESALFRARRRLGEEYEELSSGRRCQQVCEVVDRADANTIRVLGIRARRQVAQHLSHCDDCRRYARLANAHESLFRAPAFADKVAALLPFGWLARHLGARLARRGSHGFLARHAAGAPQYLGPLASSAVLGRVAAAVLVIAAAGGGYAGVSQTTGKTAAHNAAAVLRGSPPKGAARTPVAGAGPVHRTQLPMAVAAQVRRSGGGGGHAGSPGGGAAAHRGGSASSKGSSTAPSTGSGHGGGPAPSAKGAAPAGSAGARPSSTSSGPPHTRFLGGGAGKGIVSKVVSPITSHLPSLNKPTGIVPSVPQLPGVPPINTPSVNLPPPPVPVPKPKDVVNQAGSIANNAVTTAGNTVSGLPKLGH